MDNIIHLGIDIGSTTVKAAAYDNNYNLIFNSYKRHNSRIKFETVSMFDNIYNSLGNKEATVMISGSGGLTVSEWLGCDFIQEVIACSKAVAKHIPQTDVAIELGGEDAKITYFKGSLEQRMNNTCAGGTGAFIDQMASLLDTDAAGLNEMAKSHKVIYPIAARCGVFAKSDIQPLLNEGAAKEDIAASIFQAVVNQTIGGLACGRPIRGNVAFLGGPLFFLDELRKRFIKTLKLTDRQVVFPEYSALYVAAGAAYESACKMADKIYNLGNLKNKMSKIVYGTRPVTADLPPLFKNSDELENFRKRHDKNSIERVDISEYKGKTFLGIDAGSTTTKAVLISEDKKILYTHYESNKGKPLDVVLDILKEVYKKLNKNISIAYSTATGYGEKLIKAAFNIDIGEVETISHYKAASHFNPQVDFLLDIGGQDMKCMHIKNGSIDKIILNEACSSGCGSFIESFACSLGLSVEEFAEKALFAKAPEDLGTRCTVFMNSKVKQVQKDGAGIEDISAGLCYSVIKNALVKVIKIKNFDELGENIVVQGGTFNNEAVLRAMELITKKEVIRTDISGLMGAFGAALTAMEKYSENLESTLADEKEIEKFSVTKDFKRCRGCGNKCLLTINIFNGGRKFISGNKCEKGALNITGKKNMPDKLPDLYEYTNKRIFSYKPLDNKSAIRGTIGIPRVLNIYESYPFWFTFFTYLKYKVVIPPGVDNEMYEAGMDSIPSESVCYPAKLVHAHIKYLINKKVDAVFYPCIPYEEREYEKSNNHYNCPIVTSYPENIKNNIDEIINSKLKFICPFLPMDNKENLKSRLIEVFEEFNISSKEIGQAVESAWAEKINYKNDIREKGEKVLQDIKKGKYKGIVLAGRPYHIDQDINHGIPNIITSLGYAVLTEGSISHLYKDEKPLRILDQWMYHSRLYAAADIAGRTKGLELVQLNSFGCGLDAVTTDQVEEILNGYSKLYTLIKIDEVNNTGAVKVRLRSLKAVAEKRENAAGEFDGYKRVLFTKNMKKNYTIIAPEMSPVHFRLIGHAFKASGYNLEVLPVNRNKDIEQGLKYVNNDACYPSILVTGQIIEAVKSGKYDTSRLAVMISQTGGACRASNYISFIRKALSDCGYGNIPVISLNPAGLEKHPGFKITVKLITRGLMAVVYGDLFNRLILKTRPYEKISGTVKKLHNIWEKKAIDNIYNGSRLQYRKNIKNIIRDFGRIEITEKIKPVVGIVGEILVKYHTGANNNIIKTLEKEGAEVRVPDLMDFFMYCAYNFDFKYRTLKRKISSMLAGHLSIYYMETFRKYMKKQLEKTKRFSFPTGIRIKAAKAAQFLSLGNQSGEGWFLTGEMAEMIENGIRNIVCIQPFACLPNHIVGKGMIHSIREKYTYANITAIDYDPGASEINQVNRIKLMMASALNNL